MQHITIIKVRWWNTFHVNCRSYYSYSMCNNQIRTTSLRTIESCVTKMCERKSYTKWPQTQPDVLQPLFCFQDGPCSYGKTAVSPWTQPERGPHGRATLIMYKISLIKFIERVTVWFLPRGSLRVPCPRPHLALFGASEPADFASPRSLHWL